MLSLHVEMSKCGYQEKDYASTLLGTGASWCAKISTLPLCSISEHPIFFSGEMLLVNFGLCINLVSFWLYSGVLDLM